LRGLILAGGYGTRLRPLTYSQQKQLIPVANKPILFYAILDVIKAGVKEIGIVVGSNKEKVIETVNGVDWDADISFIHQEKPMGIAHAVKVSGDFIEDEPFVTYLGDNILKGGIVNHKKSFEESGADAGILISPVENPQAFGIVEVDDKGNVKRLVEKPKEPPSNLALAGIYFFNSSIFEAISHLKPSGRNQFEITEAIQWLLENGYKINSTVVEGWWKDTGKPEDILEANRLVLDEIKPTNEGEVEAGASVQGRVSIGKNTIIKGGSVVKGPSIIGRGCEIGPNTYIAPYTSIGDNCKIINGEIESSIIMNGAIINCKKKIVDSLIGINVKILESERVPRGCRFVIGDSSDVRI
jgi:glucose-1-phosphate thymidylyltransferase